jgi:hypothetical protein
MTLLKKAALPFLLAIGVGAPGAQAASITTPLSSFPTTINNAGNIVNFLGFNSVNNPSFTPDITPGSVLTSVFLTIKGTSGGSTTAENYAPFASAFSGTGDFGLSANTTTNTFSNTTAATVIPCGGGIACTGGLPAGVASSTIASTGKTFSWNVLAPGSAAFFSTPTVALTVNSFFNPGFTPGGPFKSADASTFFLDPAFTHTITYNFAEPATVPGPLPLVGGMTAFAFSRRLRRRISSAAL